MIFRLYKICKLKKLTRSYWKKNVLNNKCLPFKK